MNTRSIICLLLCSLLGFKAFSASKHTDSSPATKSQSNLVESKTILESDLSAELEQELPERFIQERETEYLEFVITPHRRNYILPFSYQDEPNNEPWNAAQSYLEADPMEHSEIKLQLSFKVPIFENDLFYDGDEFYFGFTMKSFWQAYNSRISAPFRETNYRPEFFYQAPFALPNQYGSLFLRAGIEHESNGRSQLLSRSWNRAYVGLGFLRKHWAIYLQPWYRLPEDDKEDDSDPLTPPPAKGDDNPNIQDFYGNFELLTVYERQDFQIGAMLRSNPTTHKGALELSYSFPLYGRLRGLVQYFDGYGDSLLDYDYRNQRISLGILLTDFL